MKTIAVQCPHCQFTGRIPDTARGREIGCKQCGRKFAAIPVRDGSEKAPTWEAEEDEASDATSVRSVATAALPWYVVLPAFILGVFAVATLIAWANDEPLRNAMSAGVVWTLWALAIGVGVTIYILPILIAQNRKHRNTPAIAALTILGGWTILAWCAAIAWALYNPPETTAGNR